MHFDVADEIVRGDVQFAFGFGVALSLEIDIIAKPGCASVGQFYVANKI